MKKKNNNLFSSFCFLYFVHQTKYNVNLFSSYIRKDYLII